METINHKSDHVNVDLRKRQATRTGFPLSQTVAETVWLQSGIINSASHTHYLSNTRATKRKSVEFATTRGARA